jgi:hypothetical protein
LLQELDSAGLLATPSNPSPRAFSAGDVGRLPYLNAVIKEGLVRGRWGHALPERQGRRLGDSRHR